MASVQPHQYDHYFQERKLRIFGPTADAAQLEGSKAFCKKVLHRGDVPTAAHPICSLLFQSLIMSMMNDGTTWRLEFIACNGLHKLTFESWVEKKDGLVSPLPKPRLCIFAMLIFKNLNT